MLVQNHCERLYVDASLSLSTTASFLVEAVYTVFSFMFHIFAKNISLVPEVVFQKHIFGISEIYGIFVPFYKRNKINFVQHKTFARWRQQFPVVLNMKGASSFCEPL